MDENVFIKNKLVINAKKLVKVSDTSINEYIDKTDLLAAKMNEVMIKREDILELIGGDKNIRMMKDNYKNHLRFVGSIMLTPNADTLVDTFLWEFHAYMSRGFTSNYWAAQINTWIELLKENLSKKAFMEILSIYNYLSVNIPEFVIITENRLETMKKMDNE
ncbi:hypothetical protein [Clostridium sp.]|uniref:hypothetical protein n=1 Tax=Clostridium sp. TaxID=1506 RepID=UPI0026218D43|nr:hypothetical protein [uncultured Clostridium sp.]